MPIQIFDPRRRPRRGSIKYAPRPKSLAGLRLGLVDNTKHNSDQLLLRIAVDSRERARRQDAHHPQEAQLGRRAARRNHRGVQIQLRRRRRGRRRLRVVLVGQCARQYRFRTARDSLGVDHHAAVQAHGPRHGQDLGPSRFPFPRDAAPDRQPRRRGARSARAGDRAGGGEAAAGRPEGVAFGPRQQTHGA